MFLFEHPAANAISRIAANLFARFMAQASSGVAVCPSYPPRHLGAALVGRDSLQLRFGHEFGLECRQHRGLASGHALAISVFVYLEGFARCATPIELFGTSESGITQT